MVAGAITLVNRTVQTEPLNRQMQSFADDIMNVQSETAAQIYNAEGIEGLNRFLDRLQISKRIMRVGLFNSKGEQIAGESFEENTENVFKNSLSSDKTEIDRSNANSLFAKKTELSSGETVVLVTLWKRPNFNGYFYPSERQFYRLLAIVFIAGLFSYSLARYLTSPIAELRMATQKFANGDLQTRVGEKIGKGRDEISNLARDFDEMAERIETLVTSEKRLTQDISHELRSPLARLNVALELAKGKANPETMPQIERIETESFRLNEMISQLLTLSKLETNSQSFDKTEVNLTKVFEQVAADADFEANAKNKSVKILQNDQVKVFGNEILLRSAIENVIRNAVRYTPENTSVEISLKEENKNARIVIRDFGEGVPEEDLEKLFRPFYRVQTARDRKTGGIGLGLAIAERAVNAHHGLIKAKNLEKGFIVVINLPNLK